MTDSSARYKNLNHNVVIDLVKTFAPNIPEGGVCNGFTSMWLQAYLGGKEKEQDFYNRLDRISAFIIQNHDFKNLKNEIETLYKERSEKLKKIRTEEREKTIVERNYSLPLTKEQENELEKIDKQVRDQFPPFTEDELKIIELRAFAEAVAIQQDPDALGLVGFETLEPNEQNTKVFKEPQSKYQINQDDKNLLYSITMDEKDQKINANLVGIVVTNRDDLKKYFSELAEIIKIEYKNDSLEKQSRTVSFLLGSDNHTVGAYFDLNTDSWHFLDINHLSKKETYFFDIHSETLSDIIFTSFSDSRSVNTALSIQCLSKGVNNHFIEQLKEPAKNRLSSAIGKTNSRMINSLHLASREGELEYVNELINKIESRDLNVQNLNGHTALILAVIKGQTAIAQALIKAGADIKLKNSNGDTTLMVAAINGHKKIVEVLINTGADLNAQNDHRNTALMLAAMNGHKDIVEVLIKAGSDVNAQNADGFTALIAAAEKGHSDIAEILIKEKADFMLHTSKGNNALIYSAANGLTKICNLLINAGADPNTQNKSGYTALMLAAQNGHKEIFEALRVKAKTEHINIQGLDGFTALMLAAQNGHKEIVEALIIEGSNLNTQNKSGYTALMLAAQNGHKEIVEALRVKEKIEHINIQGLDGFTALMLAAENGHKEIVDALLVKAIPEDISIRASDGNTALLLAIENGYTEIAKTLINAGADFNIKNANGDSALLLAVKKGHVEIAKALIKAKADVNLKNSYGEPLLHIIARTAETEIFNVLIEAGADLNLTNSYGDTVMMQATCFDQIIIVEALINADADLDAQDQIGNTALMIAAATGRKKIVEALIKARADVNLKNKNGETALMLAEKNGFKDLVTILEKSTEQKASTDINSDPLLQKPITYTPGLSAQTAKNIASETDIVPPEVKNGRKMPQG